VKVDADLVQGEVHDRGVEGDHDRGAHDDDQCDPRRAFVVVHASVRRVVLEDGGFVAADTSASVARASRSSVTRSSRGCAIHRR
jgi:hypothetical protein